MSSPISYYTEYLPRVSSIVVSLQPLLPGVTVSEISLASPILLVVHLSNGLDVPIALSHSAYHPYNKISSSALQYDQATGCYSMKLRCADLVLEVISRSNNHFMTFNSHYKWNAKYLNTFKSKDGFSLSCAGCGAPVIVSDQVGRINELPSELWSEMMEFWHCHKPHHEGHNHGHNHDHVDATRYSVLKPGKKSVNVGLYYFSINDNDIFSSSLRIDIDDIDFTTNTTSAKCIKCSNILGELDFKTSLIRIFKWNLKLQRPNIDKNTQIDEAFRPYSFAYSLIVDLINSSASRVFQVVNNESSSPNSRNNQNCTTVSPSKLYIWVFNTGIDVSVSSFSILTNCLKVYYSFNLDDIESERQTANGKSFRNEIESEEIELPRDVYEDFLGVLKNTHKRLPASCNIMGKWKMGLVPFDLN